MRSAPEPGTLQDTCVFCAVNGGRLHPSIANLGLPADRDKYVLSETDSFMVVPCLGALTDWYVLVSPRRHVLSAGKLTHGERAELRVALERVRRWLHRHSRRQVLIFEHGAYDFRDQGGSSFDHSHIHVAATNRPVDGLLEAASGEVVLRPCDDWLRAAAELLEHGKCSYFALELPGQHYIGRATGAPSHYFRRCLVRWLGAADEEWDFLRYPHVSRVLKMIDRSAAHPLQLGEQGGSVH